MIKTILFSVAVLILSQILKLYKPDYSLIFTVTAIILFSIYLLNSFRSEFTFDLFNTLSNEYSAYIKILIKAAGIIIVTEIASDICKDNGESALATVAELTGKLSVLSLCMPMLKSLLIMAMGILEI